MQTKLLEDYILARDEKKNIRTELYKVDKNIFGEPVLTFIGSNDLLLGGRYFTLQKWANITLDNLPPTLNEDLNVDNDYAYPPKGLELNDIVFLLGCGIDGAGETIGSTKEVDIKSKGFNDINDMIPFRTVTVGSADETQCDQIYACKKVVGNIAMYYLKNTKIDPSIYCNFEDGTPVTKNTWSSDKNIPINTYIDYQFVIDNKDFREHFQKIGKVSECRYNSICLYAGIKTVDGKYKNLRAVTKYNTDNEPLDKGERTINLIYRVYCN